MPGKWERISITINVGILDNFKIKTSSHGPFKANVPKMSLDDMYKFMVFTLLDKNFTLLSAQVISAIGCKIITHNKQFFIHHSMEGLDLESYLLNG